MYDKELKQIKEKYRAPEYRPSTKIKNSYTRISIGIIILAILAFATVYFFVIWGNRAGTDDFVFPCCSTFILFLILLSYVKEEVKKSDIVSSEESWGAVIVMVAGFILLIKAIHAFWTNDNPGDWAGFYCCSSILILILPLWVLDITDTDKAKQELDLKRKKEKRVAQQHKRDWGKAQRNEENEKFDEATKIWIQLDERGEITRLNKLKIGTLHIRLKEKIHNLKEKGIETNNLEEKLTTLENNRRFLEI